MGFTKAQLRAIMSTRGQAYIPPNRIAYSGRVCETYLRRKLYRLEDRAAVAEYALTTAAYRDIREFGLSVANNSGLSELKNDVYSLQWQRRVKEYVKLRLWQLGDALAYNAYKWATLAYTASFYGRQWQLDSLLPNASGIQRQRLTPAATGQAVLQPTLEAFRVDNETYAAVGQEWRESYSTAVNLTALKVQRSLSSNSSEPQSVLAALGTISLAMGISSKPGVKTTGLYATTSLQTRNSVMRASNHASAAAYQLNPVLIPALMWVSSRDSKVCPTCARLDGTIYPLEGMAGLILFSLPPDGSHWGCRCGVIPTLVPSLETSELPPDMTYEEWLIEFGTIDELDEFFADDILESTRLEGVI